MKKCIGILLVGLLSTTVYADYSFQNGSVCNGDVCSVETCDVTEFLPTVVQTTTEYPDADISSALYDYLIAQGETTFANRLSGTVCLSDSTYIETVEEEISPAPITVCSWSVPFCGDSVIDAETGEECDAGNDQNGKSTAGCSADCKIVSYCGDSLTQPELGEECDEGSDKNGVEFSGCDAECKQVGFCGDEVVQTALGEECDPSYDAEYCNMDTCTFIEGLPVDFDLKLWDPVSCEENFNGGIVLSEGDTNYAGVSMYLDVKCPGSDHFVSLNPVINSEGNYVGELEYADTTSERYLMGQCEVKYGGCNVTDQGTICIDKTANEFLEGRCLLTNTQGSSGGGGAYNAVLNDKNGGGNTVGANDSGSNGGDAFVVTISGSSSGSPELFDSASTAVTISGGPSTVGSFYDILPELGEATLFLQDGNGINFPAGGLLETGGY